MMTQKSRKVRILAPALLLALAGCFPGERGSGREASETRKLPAFTVLQLAGVFSLEVTAGKQQSVRLTGDDNLLPLVTTESMGERLHVDLRRPVSPRGDLRLKVTVPRLEKLVISGASHATLAGLSGERFGLNASGASSVTASGQVQRLEVKASGASRIRATGLAAQTASVVISGAGRADVQVSKELEASISGAGSIRYRGDPTVKQNVSGAGSVGRLGED